MGHQTIAQTTRWLKDKKMSTYNKYTLELARAQIESSLKDIGGAANLVCDILPLSENFSSPATLPSHRSWLSDITGELNNFVKSGLPGRERLAVAVGIAKMVHKGNHYKSFTEPLIRAITALFNHLEFQSRTELTLIHFLAFQEIFVRSADKALDINNLISFGPEMSRTSFSQLISPNDLKSLERTANHLNINLGSFRKQRITRRLINSAQFVVNHEQTNASVCSELSASCSCSSGKISIFIPSTPPAPTCLQRINDNKFRDHNGSTYLSVGSLATTVSKGLIGAGMGAGDGMIRILTPPVVKLSNDIQGWLVSKTSFFLPDSLNGSISVSCESLKKALPGNINSTIKINGPGILRIMTGCNYSTADRKLSVFFPITHSQIQLNRQFNQNLLNFSFIEIDNRLSPEETAKLEKRFEKALDGEDSLQSAISELQAESWIKSWISMLIETMIPGVSVLVTVIIIIIVIYLTCCCLPKCKCKGQKCKDKDSNKDNLEIRVEKLENLFTFFVNSNYHQIENDDIKEKLKAPA